MLHRYEEMRIKNGQNGDEAILVICSPATPDPLPVEMTRIRRMYPAVNCFWVYGHNVWGPDCESGFRKAIKDRYEP